MKDQIHPMWNTQTEEVLNLWQSVNIATHNFISTDYWASHREEIRDRYMPASATYVYEEDRILKGFLSLVDRRYVGALFVVEIYQGQGIGHALMEYVMSFCFQLELKVYQENKKAIAFYRQCGFQITNEQRDESTGHLEYVMCWNKFHRRKSME